MIAMFCLAMHGYSEVHTWVDEQGKRHFGDAVPPEYAEQANKVDIEEPNLIDPEPSVEKLNRRYRAELDFKYQNKRRAQENARQNNAAPATQQEPAGPDQCWQRYPHPSVAKKRTQCLKSFE
jgi:hypothetical protein